MCVPLCVRCCAPQVCDDSTRESVRQKVDAAVISCLEQGHNVQLVRRDNRSGFKAGAMVDGMQRVEDQGFEYVAIFDADFEPPEDFLYQTIIHMVRGLALGLSCHTHVPGCLLQGLPCSRVSVLCVCAGVCVY